MVPAAREHLAALLSERLDTTSAGVELAIARAFAGMRAINLFQLWLAVSVLLVASPNQPLDAALVVLYSSWSVAAITIVLRQRRVTDARVVITDLAVAVLCVGATGYITSAPSQALTWHAWPHPVSLSTALLLGAGLSLRAALTGSTLLAFVYGAFGALTEPGQEWTVLTNTAAYLAFTIIAAALSGYLRRLGADADAERERAAQLGARVGAEAEMERHRRLLHDHAALLNFIGNGNIGDDPTLQASLRRQALDGANRVNAFLSSTAATPRPPVHTLAEVVQHAAGAFSDLPLTVNADLAAEYPLRAPPLDVVDGAITTLLHNVRTHAAATSCTIHAVGTGTWFEVTVRDDGVGFDPASTTPGYGLSRQVRGACAAVGIDVMVDSAPGEGTTVTLSFGQPAHDDEPGDAFDTELSRSGDC